MQLLVLSDKLELAAIGQVGEIAGRTSYLALGYLDDSATSKFFLTNPFTHHQGDRIYMTGDLGHFSVSGDVEILGRKDRQVTMRGRRATPCFVLYNDCHCSTITHLTSIHLYRHRSSNWARRNRSCLKQASKYSSEFGFLIWEGPRQIFGCVCCESRIVCCKRVARVSERAITTLHGPE